MTTSGKRLESRRILVTGAASGMGAAISRLFAAEGAQIALLDISDEAVGEVASSIGQHAFPVDVADTAAVRQTVDKAADRLGGLDGLVNAAGILRQKPFEDTDEADMAALIGVNLAGPINVTRAILPHLRAAPSATIVNIASMAGMRPPPGLAVYAATKAGLMAFGVALAGELGAKIRLNTICPGVIRTPMVQSHFDSGFMDDAALGRIAQLGRAGTVDEIAATALFLSSDESSYISAAALAVNGGQLT